MKICGTAFRWIFYFFVFCSLNNAAIIDIISKNRYSLFSSLSAPPKHKQFKILLSAYTVSRSEVRFHAENTQENPAEKRDYIFSTGDYCCLYLPDRAETHFPDTGFSATRSGRAPPISA